MGYCSPGPLGPDHRSETFACGEPALDDWLHRHARPSHAAGGARVYVTTHSDNPHAIVGYYALTAAQVEPTDATQRLATGQPAQRALPVVLLARLAVDRAHQGRHLGSSLLRDAMTRVVQAADVVGIRALTVHAKHNQARAFYEQYGFEPSPTDPLHLIMLLKDLKHYLRSCL
jgi:GNAT superfamily N-acetyltransferase